MASVLPAPGTVEAFFAARPRLTEQARELVVIEHPSEIAPWERIVVPQDVDGSAGTFPAPPGVAQAGHIHLTRPVRHVTASTVRHSEIIQPG